MLVKDGMSAVVLTVGPGHSLREAARLMAERKIGAAVVMDPDIPTPGIVTERDILESIGNGQDPERSVSGSPDRGAIVASPEWGLEHAAETMVENGFRHLMVINGGELLGILSMRDIVRCWTRTARSRRAPARRRATGCRRRRPAGRLRRLASAARSAAWRCRGARR